MLGIEVRRLRFLPLKAKSCLGGTAQQGKKLCNIAFVSKWRIMAASRYEEALPTGTEGLQRVSGCWASGRKGPWMRYVCSAS